MKRGRQEKGRRGKIQVNEDEESPSYKKDMASFVDHLDEDTFEGSDLDEEALSANKGGEVIHVPQKFKWKKVDVTNGFMTGLKNSGFVELEEMDESDYLKMLKESEEKVDKKKGKKKVEEKEESESESEAEEEEEEEEEEGSEQEEEKEEKKPKKLKGKPLPAQPFADTLEEVEAVNSVKDAWSQFSLCTKVLAGVRSLHFEKPTPVQERVLPAAIDAGLDIIAAAETGSGKTLAYAIPVVNTIVQTKLDAGSTENTSMKALILTPTRELALQVADHIKQFTSGLPVRVAAVVGGMSMQKQERLLRMCPDIVVATTGRLWELISEQSNEYLSNVADLQSFVLDEADRMIEVGHFRELDEINKLIHGRCARKLQTFILSATLSVSTRSHRLLEKVEASQSAKRRDSWHGRRDRRKKKSKRPAHPTRDDFETPLDQVIAAVDFRRKVEIIDLTTQHVTVQGLYEYRLMCQNEDKDTYLYWILRTVTGVPALAGRTIVFTNAISMTKRLVSLLRLVRIPVARLHAGMQQRQRLRALDYFRNHESCVLVASDVAARGLDIPEVSYVIHYGVPRTADIYIHRAGRTARAGRRGISICLVGPDEVPHFRALCNQMGKEAMLKFKGPESLAVLAAHPEKVPTDKNVVPFSRIAPMMTTAHLLNNELRLAAADARKKKWIITMAKGMLGDDGGDDADVFDDADDKEENEEEEEDEVEEVAEEPKKKKSKKSRKGGRDDMVDKLSVDKEIADMKIVMSALGEDDSDDDDAETVRKRKKLGKLSGLLAADDGDAVAERRATLHSWKLMVAELKEKLARQLAEIAAPTLCEALQTMSGTGGFGKRAVPIGSGLNMSTLEEAIANVRARHATLGKLEGKHQAKYASKSKRAALMRPELNPKIRPRSAYNKNMRRRLCKLL